MRRVAACLVTRAACSVCRYDASVSRSPSVRKDQTITSLTILLSLSTRYVWIPPGIARRTWLAVGGDGWPWGAAGTGRLRRGLVAGPAPPGRPGPLPASRPAVARGTVATGSPVPVG